MRRSALLTVLLALGICIVPLALVADDLPNASFETIGETGMPDGWAYYNWGFAESNGIAARSDQTAHTGEACLRAESRDGSSRPGAYTHVPLEPGRYALRFFAKAEPGRTALVRAYLADRYSPPYLVPDEWTEFVVRHTVRKRRLRAEINVQNFGGDPGVVWFDDVTLEQLPGVKAEIVADQRKPSEQPRLLYFSANLNHVADTATQWTSRGFSGFFFSYIFHDWVTDVWAQDGKPATRGRDDLLIQEAQACIDKSLKAGLSHQVLKVAFYTDLPDPFDDEAYGGLRRRFREGARFAREAGFRMLAIDTEYVAEQYQYNWDGYDYERYTRGELSSKLRERWREVGVAIAREHPTLAIGVLPEGMVYYGPLWMSVFGGLLEGLQEGNSEGDVHVFCEGTYSVRDPESIKDHADAVRALAAAHLSGPALDWWQAHGKVALGAWPLGYYRAITDADGKFIGWSGKAETFGDKIVGSYADKSSRFPLDEFEMQLAAIRTFSDDYCWIYGHGSSWWQLDVAQADAYEKKIHGFPRDNYLVPCVENIGEYYQAAAARNVIRFLPEEE